MAITLEGVNPTLFNFFSGLLSVLGQSLLLFLLSLTYGAFINWHLSSEEKMIPASMLGQVPANFASALTKLINQHLQLSFPLLILIVLFACADFSDSIARLGVAYVPTLQKGDLNTVLTLHHEKRNPNRLIETAGDPVSLYTAPITYDGQNGLGDTEEEWDQETINNGGKAWDLARSFMSAVENVATGESALSNYPLSNLSYSQYDWIPFMGYETSVWTNADGGPIASIPLEIPLNCTSERMVQYIQTQGYGLTQEDIDAFRANGIDANVVVYGALLPNCTYTAARASGIFDEDSGALTDAEIVEHALLVPHQSFHYAGGVAPEYGLIRNGELFRYAGATFELSPDDKTLAKDRSNWKEGRIVEGIEGLRYGNEVIEFNRTVISSGPLIQVVNKPGADITSTNPNNYDYIHSYMLVSTVKECPSPPSGIITTSQCLAFVFIECSRFNEDFEPLQNQFVQEPSSCIVSESHLVWSRNFVMDAELAAVVAGLHGIIQPNIQIDVMKQRAFLRNSILGALFALGTLDMEPSINIVIAPRINAVYFTFMTLPLLIACLLFLGMCCRDDKGKDIPTTSYHMLMWGSESHGSVKMPKRKTNEFPTKVNNRIMYSRSKQEDGTISGKLWVREDPDRVLLDHFLRQAASGMLHRMESDDQRKEWIEKCLQDTGHENSTAPGKKWDSFLTQKIMDRLEFLNPEERRQWLSLLTGENKDSNCKKADKCPDCTDVDTSVSASGNGREDEIASPAVALPAEWYDGKKNLAPYGSCQSKGDEGDEEQALTKSNHSRCSTKRRKIRDERERCVVCQLGRCTPTPVGAKTTTTKGCRGCQLVVCKEHWENFDHDKSLYAV